MKQADLEFKQMKKILYIMLFGILCAKCSKPGKYASGMLSVSEKGYGVMVTKIIQHNEFEVPSNTVTDTICINPGILGDYAKITSLRKSKEVPQSTLPNYLTLEYQYVQLSDCRYINEEKTVKLIFLSDYSPLKKGDIREVAREQADFFLKRTSGIATLASMSNKTNTRETVLKQYLEELKTAKTYITKSGCKTWTPIDSLKFVKTLDLRPYKKSEEIRKFKKRNKSVAGGYYGTRITYQFYDNGEIKLHLENYTTNPWK